MDAIDLLNDIYSAVVAIDRDNFTTAFCSVQSATLEWISCLGNGNVFVGNMLTASGLLSQVYDVGVTSPRMDIRAQVLQTMRCKHVRLYYFSSI